MKTLLLASALLFGTVATTSAAPVMSSTASVFDHQIGPKTVRVQAQNLSNAMFTFEKFYARDGQLFTQGTLTGVATDGSNFSRVVGALVSITSVNCDMITLAVDPLTLQIRVGANMITQNIVISDYSFRISDRPEYKNLVENKLCLIERMIEKEKSNLNAIANQLTSLVRALPYK